MAYLDSKKFLAYEYGKGLGSYNHATDVFKYALVSNTFASLDAHASQMRLSDLSVIGSAGAYVSGTTIANTDWTQGADSVALDGDDFSIAADSGNPQNACCLVIYNDTSTNKDVLCAWDITQDGATPYDLRAGLVWTVNAAGLVSVAVNA